jgi:hypothetical protein
VLIGQTSIRSLVKPFADLSCVVQGNQEVFCSAVGYMALNSSTSADVRSQIQAHLQRMFADGIFQKTYPPSPPPVSPSTLPPTLHPDLLVNDRADLSDFLLTSL